MSARFRTFTLFGDATTALRALGPAVRDIVAGLIGEAPIDLPAARPRMLVGLLSGGYAVCLAVFGAEGVELLGVPVFAAAMLLSGPAAALSVAICVAITVAMDGALPSVPLILVSALFVRSMVVAAISTRTHGMRRDALAQLSVLQAASARLSRAGEVEAVGRAIVEETRRIIDYHNARVYLLEPSGDVVPIAFEGTVGAYERVDFNLLRCRVGQGFTGWVAKHGIPLVVGNANDDPRGATIPGTDDVDESMLVVPMSYDGTVVGVITLSKLGLDQFDVDDERLLLILADQGATAIESARLLARSQALAGELRRLLDMSGELSASLDSRQVADLIASHLARAMNVDQCTISYWDRVGRRVVTLGNYPDIPDGEFEPSYGIGGFPETSRVLETQATVIVDAEDPAADPAEVELLRRDRYRSVVMLPLVAKGQAIGLVELFSKTAVEMADERLEVARTMANEAAMALENARLYEEARALADRDPLTGFANHRYLHERLGEEVVRAQRSRQPLSILMLDLDDFKIVNDTFGHLFGDKVLVWTAKVIRGTLRQTDVAARYGGDEFAILLPETTPDAAARAADRIRQAFASTAFSGGSRRSVAVSLSIGAATFPDDGRSGTDLIAAADKRLYVEKRLRSEPSLRLTSDPPASVADDPPLTA